VGCRDADGNRTGVTLSGSTTTSTFDYEDRLTGIGANVSYSYIGAGTDRYNKTVSGTTMQFLYDGGSVDEEMQGTTVTADYSAGAEKLSGTLYWMLQDGQGSTRQLLNSSQATVASYTTDAYGNSVASSGSAANPFQWNGGSAYYSDSESGLQKVGARFYEPATGRWISQDSELIAGSPADSQAVNRYLYCGANPISNSDPNGHDGEGVTLLRSILLYGTGVGIVGVMLIELYVEVYQIVVDMVAQRYINEEVRLHPPDLNTETGQFIYALANGRAVSTGKELSRVAVHHIYGSPTGGISPGAP
jgi:RHS repeat-associated protein